jgi:cysteine synthase
VKRGVLYTWHEAEGKRLKNPFDTITEGVGLNRLTANFAAAAVDDAVRVTDREAVEMAAYLLRCVCLMHPVVVVPWVLVSSDSCWGSLCPAEC